VLWWLCQSTVVYVSGHLHTILIQTLIQKYIILVKDNKKLTFIPDREKYWIEYIWNMMDDSYEND